MDRLRYFPPVACVATSGLHPQQLERPSLQFGGLRLEDGEDGDRGEEGTVTFSRVASREHPIGPNLIRGSEKDPESLLVNILDPNRFVEPQYLQYVATGPQRGALHWFANG